MAPVFRTSDLTRWGSGKGSDLTPTEQDLNIWGLDQKIDAVELLSPVGIASFYVSGGSLYEVLTDGTQRGPFPFPVAVPAFKGAWTPLTAYVATDEFTQAGALYRVLLAHTSASTFSAGANDGLGHNYYGLLNPAARGVPAAGLAGTVLAKLSNTDFDTGWISAGVPIGGTATQVLSKIDSTDFNTQWSAVTGVTPYAGTAGQVLTKNSSTNYDYSWDTPSPFAFQTLGSLPLGLAAAGTIIKGNGGIITIPTNASVAFPVGSSIIIINMIATATTIVGAGGVTLLPSGAIDFVLEGYGKLAILTQTSTDNWSINGQLRPGVLAASSYSGATTVAFDYYDILELTPTANVTFNTPISQVRKRITFVFTTSGVTSYTMTFGTNYVSQGTLATGTVTGKTFVVEFQGDGTSYYEISRTVAM
jgi:hypothetical protein